MNRNLFAPVLAVGLAATILVPAAVGQAGRAEAVFAYLGANRFPGGEGITAMVMLEFVGESEMRLAIQLTGSPTRRWSIRVYSRGSCDHVTNWVVNRGVDGLALPSVASNAGRVVQPIFGADVRRVRDALGRGERLALVVAGLHPTSNQSYRTCSSFGATAVPTVTATVTTTTRATPRGSVVAGCGAAVVGGAGGRVLEVDTWRELTAAAETPGRRVIRVSGVIDGEGGEVIITHPYVTVEGPATLVNAWVQVRAGQVIIRDLRIRVGDAVSADADAISINNASDVVVDHVEAVWGPDVGGITILDDSDRITVQHSIIGVGLYLSSHPEGTLAHGGHSYAFNIAGQHPGLAPDCVTAYRNLILLSFGRNPQVQGASAVDVINNVIYAGAQSPQGNPRGLNLAGNLYRRGPAPSAAGLREERWAFRSRASIHHPRIYPATVYLADNEADGFALESPPDTVALRETLAHPYSVTPEPVGGLLGRVLADVGPTPDATTNGWLANVRDRTGVYFNGAGYPAPNPGW